MKNAIPAVLLAGGLGTRMREETEYRPKPMVEIGGQPVLWHIMKNLSSANISEFVVCTGYKGQQIKDYFLNYHTSNHDFTVQLNQHSDIKIHKDEPLENWAVTVADTGQNTMTGGRVKRIRKYVDGRRFLVTYGDGLANVDIDKLLKFHESHGRIATVSTVRPMSRFGIMDIDPDGTVRKFREKPQVDDWVNIGFFVFESSIFEYLNDDCVLEREPLEALAKKGELRAFQHQGFWQPMDTYRESLLLNEMWESNLAPWKTW
jgi:glucose-1-phosphate cytidylyltransferase